MNDACPGIRAEAEKALEIDPHLADALVIRAGLRCRCAFDWTAAEPEYRRAIELAPGSAFVHQNYASYLGSLGRHDEALEEIRTAERLDPLSEQIAVYHGQRLAYARRYDEALSQFRKALSVHPESVFARWALANTLTSLKRYDEAIEIYLSRKVSDPGMNFAAGQAYGLAGRKAEARKVLEFLIEKRKKQYVPADQIACVYGGLGEMDKGFEWLNRAYEERAFIIPEAKVSPHFDVFRGDPRFDALLRRLKFPA
jgi:tetratricopeptide (TPR) repeat protein